MSNAFIKTNTRLYSILQGMKTRCYNKNHQSYKHYGGRGIKICDAWLNDFMNFYNWAYNNGYDNSLTIDRIDVNGNYEPSNCRWITHEEQQKNRRDSIQLTYNGKTQTIKDWSDDLGINAVTIYYRHKKGYSISDCLFTGSHLDKYYNGERRGKPMTELTKRLAFRCTEDFYNEVKEIASEKGLSYTDYITFLIMDDMANYYDEKGGE